jgi:dipeptide transport system permease protein
MFGFILRRVGMIIPTFIGMTLLVFLMIHMIPGNVVESMSGERGMEPERYARLMREFGLDKPLYEQYFNYIKKVVQGDLGHSISTHEPVMKEFLALFPATLELSFFAMLFALVIGVPIGILAALKRNSVFDYTAMGISLTGYSMPLFWWALLLILLFSVTLGWTPVSGRLDIEYDFPARTGFMVVDSLLSGEPGAFRSALSHLILPTIALGTIPLAVIARMTRSSMLEVLREDYIRTARAKGLSRWRVIAVHALRNAMIPVVTIIGLAVGSMLAGAVLTETIFSWPGIGKWLMEAIRRRDYPVVQGGILLSSTIVITVNLIVDVLYGVINPRIRHTS